jgi:hypothetical protein
MLKTPHPVPQEVQEWLCTLDDESLIEILESINDDPRELPPRRLPTVDDLTMLEGEYEADKGRLESVELSSYGVFLTNDHVRVEKVLPLDERAKMTEAEREAYTSRLNIVRDPSEYCGRIVEAPNRDMAIYTAGLLDGVDQAEAQGQPEFFAL